MTLNDIDALFDRMNPDEQLLLIDHLAERTQVYDELLLYGIAKAAFAHFNGFCSDPDDAADRAERFIPTGPSHAVWKAHAIKRDATLEGAIRLRALGRAA